MWCSVHNGSILLSLHVCEEETQTLTNYRWRNIIVMGPSRNCFALQPNALIIWLRTVWWSLYHTQSQSKEKNCASSLIRAPPVCFVEGVIYNGASQIFFFPSHWQMNSLHVPNGLLWTEGHIVWALHINILQSFHSSILCHLMNLCLASFQCYRLYLTSSAWSTVHIEQL